MSQKGRVEIVIIVGKQSFLIVIVVWVKIPVGVEEKEVAVTEDGIRFEFE
jgi:hypothetical protein